MPALDFHGQRFFQGVGGADFHFDVFGRALTHQHVVLALQIGGNGFVHFIAGDPHRTAVNNSGKGDDGNIRSAAADVHDHAPGRLGNGQARANGRHHRLLHQKDFTSPGTHGGILDGAFFHLGNFRGHADHDARVNEHGAVMRLLDKVIQHLFRHLKVGDDTIFQGANGNDVTGRAPQHLLGIAPHGFDIPIDLIDGDDGRLIDYNSLALGKHQGIGGAQVNGEVGGKNTE